MRNRNVFERNPLEYARIAQALGGVENLDADQMSIGIVVCGNALAQRHRRHCSLSEADVECVHFLVAGDPPVVYP